MAKQGTCAKCGRKGIVHEHHVFPKSIFGDKPPLVELCPNCHEDFHDLLGREHLSNADKQFHLSFFTSWILGIIGSLVLLVLWLWR